MPSTIADVHNQPNKGNPRLPITASITTSHQNVMFVYPPLIFSRLIQQLGFVALKLQE